MYDFHVCALYDVITCVGVTPTEIRFALDEFHKFSMDGTSK